MAQRGRRSAASYETPKVVEIYPRPEPPAELTAPERVEWKAVVARMPHDWFPRETHALLEAFCRAVVAARDIASRIKWDMPLADLNLMLGMRDRETKAIVSLSRTMRLSQRSHYSKDKTVPMLPKPPWED